MNCLIDHRVAVLMTVTQGPENMKLAKEIPVALGKGSTVFINYIGARSEVLTITLQSYLVLESSQPLC